MKRFACVVRVLSVLLTAAAWINPQMINAATSKPDQKAPEDLSGTAGNCYKQNKPRWPYVDGGDYAVCKAVLALMNRTCDGPRQRTINPGPKSPITLPVWTVLDSAANLNLVKTAYLASSNPEHRERDWKLAEASIRAIVQAKQLTLRRAEITVRNAPEKYRVVSVDWLDETAPPLFGPTTIVVDQNDELHPNLLRNQEVFRGDVFYFAKRAYLYQTDADTGVYVRELRHGKTVDGEVYPAMNCELVRTSTKKGKLNAIKFQYSADGSVFNGAIFKGAGLD